MRNETINAACKNLTGGTPNQAGYPKGTGNLWNGMVLPLINMTIKGATVCRYTATETLLPPLLLMIEMAI